jgi:hypothetical protein
MPQMERKKKTTKWHQKKVLFLEMRWLKIENIFFQAASIMLLAKMSNVGGADSRGACKRCGMVGHLTFQVIVDFI